MNKFTQESAKDSSESKSPKSFHVKIDKERFNQISNETTRQELLKFSKKSPACRFLVYHVIREECSAEDEHKHHHEPNPKIKGDSENYLTREIDHLEHELEHMQKELEHLEQELESWHHHKEHPKLKLVHEGQIIHLLQNQTNVFFTKFVKEVTYFLCDVPVTTNELILTPRQILTKKFAEKSDQYYLKQLIDQEQKSYEENPDEPITMCPDLKFIYIFTGPMTVS